MGACHVDILRRTDPVMQIKEDATNPNCVYIGLTPDMMTATSEGKWQIRRMENVGGIVTTLFANDAKYNAVWDDRATYFPPCVGDTPVPIDNVVITEDSQGDPCIRVCGESVPLGLSSLGKIDLIPVGTASWTEVVIAPINDRRAFAIQNTDGLGVDNPDPILLNYAPFAPAGANQGWRLEPGDAKFYDANDNVNIFIRVAPGGGNFNIVFEQLA